MGTSCVCTMCAPCNPALCMVPRHMPRGIAAHGPRMQGWAFDGATGACTSIPQVSHTFWCCTVLPTADAASLTACLVATSRQWHRPSCGLQWERQCALLQAQGPVNNSRTCATALHCCERQGMVFVSPARGKAPSTDSIPSVFHACGSDCE